MYSLHTEILELVKEERRLTGLVIEKLQEIIQAKIYLKMGYATVFEYCIKALGYSEGAAHRRISAVRLSSDVPEVRTKLDQGKLSLTNVALAQTAFRKSNASLEVKRQVMADLENKSKREAESLLSEITGVDLKPKEQVRAISKEEVRLQLTVPKELLEKLDKIKALRAHKNPKQDYISLLTDMSDYILNKIDPVAKKASKKAIVDSEARPQTQPVARKAKATAATAEAAAHASAAVKGNMPAATPPTPPAVSASRKNSRYIPASIKRAVYRRDQGHCTYRDPVTHKRCQSRHFLQIDHVKLHSAGGGASLGNLRLLCHAHHRDRHERYRPRSP